MLLPHSSQLLDFVGQDCCIPCVGQVPNIAGSLALAHTFKIFCTTVNNIKAIPTWGLLLVSPLDISGD